jgi:DNA-binding Lrp family transcriptional regulator
MDDIDREILNGIQSDFPITSRPYFEMGKHLDLTEQEVFERVKRLRQEGIIRRIGGNFDSKKLDFISTLCAARVPEEKIRGFVEVVNGYKGVTHNYLRNHDYNIWFTFMAPAGEYIHNALKEISETTGIDDILDLQAVRVFKIKVNFKV